MVYMSRIRVVTLIAKNNEIVYATEVASPRGSKSGAATLVADEESKINATKVASPMQREIE